MEKVGKVVGLLVVAISCRAGARQKQIQSPVHVFYGGGPNWSHLHWICLWKDCEILAGILCHSL